MSAGVVLYKFCKIVSDNSFMHTWLPAKYAKVNLVININKKTYTVEEVGDKIATQKDIDLYRREWKDYTYKLGRN